MANILGNYDEVAFGQAALKQLYSKLGMAKTVYRDYDPTPKAKGQYMNLRRPSTFTAQDEPSTAQDLNVEGVQIQFNFHKGAKLKITDKELSLSNEKLISDHIGPMAYSVAKAIDTSLVNLGLRVPNVFQQQASTFTMDDLAGVRQTLFDLGCEVDDGNVSLMLNGQMERSILGVLGGGNIFGTGVDDARRSGVIDQLLGMRPFANQNTGSFQTTQMADVSGTVVGAHAAGVSAIAATAFSFSQASGIKQGDTFKIAGQAQRYTVMSTVSTDGAGACTLQIEPKLQVALAGGEVIDLHKIAGAARGLNLAYHRNAFALVMAPLSELGNGRGAQIATIEDPRTSLTLRTRMWYDANNSANYVGIDALWAVQVLDEDMACRFYGF